MALGMSGGKGTLHEPENRPLDFQAPLTIFRFMSTEHGGIANVTSMNRPGNLKSPAQGRWSRKNRVGPDTGTLSV